MKNRLPIVALVVTVILIFLGMELLQLTNIGTSKTVIKFELKESIEFAFSFFFGMILGFIVTEYFYNYSSFFKNKCNQSSFLFNKSLIQAFIITLFSFTFSELLFPFYVLNVGINELLLESPPIEYFQYFLILYVVTLILMILFNFFYELRRRFGVFTLMNFLTGKYSEPIEEHYVFLFIDLHNSTAICNQLGDKAFMQLIQCVFSEVAGPIKVCKGDIYQYAGDEIIICWKITNRKQKIDAIRCFLLIDQLFQKRHAFYLEKFNCQPKFRGAIHAGAVLTAAVGILKVYIEHRGEALNITARLLDFGKRHSESLMVSESALSYITPDAKMDQHFKFQWIELAGISRKISASNYSADNKHLDIY